MGFMEIELQALNISLFCKNQKWENVYSKVSMRYLTFDISNIFYYQLFSIAYINKKRYVHFTISVTNKYFLKRLSNR